MPLDLVRRRLVRCRWSFDRFGQRIWTRLDSRIRPVRRVSRNRYLGVMVGGPLLPAAARTGRRSRVPTRTAADAPSAMVAQAEMRLAGECPRAAARMTAFNSGRLKLPEAAGAG